jgi:hypothetical protein
MGVSQKDWDSLKQKESYGMFLELKKDVDSLLLDNFLLAMKIKELEERINLHNTVGEFCPHTQK